MEKLNQYSLMIGDWFRYRYTIDGKEIVHTFRISRIENELGDYYVWGERSGVIGRMCYPERLEPIPLTQDILEKNGFEKQGFPGWEISTKDYIILWRNDYQDVLDIRSFNLQYASFHDSHIHSVHELQHALRLCGIDKEIVL